MQYLKQSTSITERIGPFVDEGDGRTVEPSLSIAQGDIRLSKNGGDFAQSNDSGGATYDEFGWYYLTLDATDTNTLGRLLVAIDEAGALPVWREYMVVPANVWDSLFGADKLQVHADEITAGLITATAIATGAIAADEIAAAAANKIADHIIRRSFANAKASSDGDAKSFRSLLGAIAKLVNKLFISGDTLSITEEDDSTVLGTQTVTTAAGDPITSLDTD